MSPLDKIFEAQSNLVELYIKAEKQKPFPISLEDKDSQAFIRELFGYLQEELFEAFEILETDTGIFMVNPIQDIKVIEDHLVKFNEEISDTLCFFVEIFQYTGITEDSLYEYYSIMLEQMDLMRLSQQHDTLGTAINYAEFILQVGHRIDKRIIEVGSHNIIKHNPKVLNCSIPSKYFEAGHLISSNTVTLSQYYIFNTLKHINITRNCLKMKYWRENGDGVNYEKFNHNLMEAWLNYTVFLYLNGFNNSERLATIFMIKNGINIERVKTKW